MLCVALEAAEAHERQPPGGKGDDREHGGDGGHGECRRDQDDAGKAVRGGGVHDQGDQRLAGAEDEQGEEDPGGDVGLVLALVDVGVVAFVLVQVLVRAAVGVAVRVLVGLVLDGPVQAPDQVGEAEADEQPGGGVAAPGFGALRLPTAMPRARPRKPSTTELKTWPRPERKAIVRVFLIGHRRDLAMAMKGR